MRMIFHLFIFFIFVSNAYAINYSIQNLEKEDKYAEKILNNYLKQTNLKIEDFENINFIIGHKENISLVNESLYNEISKFENDAYIIKMIENNISL